MVFLDGLRRRLTGGGAPAVRARLEGAMARRRLRGWQPPLENINSLVAAGGPRLLARARELVVTNGYAANACEAFAVTGVDAARTTFGRYTLDIARIRAARDEPDTFRTATSLRIGSEGERTFAGIIGDNISPGNVTDVAGIDVDLYCFRPDAFVTIFTDADYPWGSPADTRVSLFDRDGIEIGDTDNGARPGEFETADAFLSGRIADGGVHFVGVSDPSAGDYDPICGTPAAEGVSGRGGPYELVVSVGEVIEDGDGASSLEGTRGGDFPGAGGGRDLVRGLAGQRDRRHLRLRAREGRHRHRDASAVDRFGDLTLAATGPGGANAAIAFDGETLAILRDVSADALDEDDFRFVELGDDFDLMTFEPEPLG